MPVREYFSADYRERRGHAYMLEDQDNTERVKQFKQPGACLHCHASIGRCGRASEPPGSLSVSSAQAENLRQRCDWVSIRKA